LAPLAQYDQRERHFIEKQGNQRFQDERNYQTGLAKPIIQEAEQSTIPLSESRMALNVAKDAIDKDQVGFFSPSNFSKMLSDITGVDLPQDATGAQLSSASKNFLINSLGKVKGGRPNIFIEQQISQAAPRIGQSKEANLRAYLPLEAGQDILENYYETVNKLYEEDLQKKGYPSGNIGLRAQKIVHPFVKDRMKKLENYFKTNSKTKDGAQNFSSLEEISTKQSPQKGDRAKNKKTGEEFAWDGNKWRSVGK